MKKLIILLLILFTASTAWGFDIKSPGSSSGSVDLTAPGPIGSVTPNTGAFTTVTNGNEAVNATLGSNLAPIDNSCTGWTLGSGWACGGDGTIVKNADGTGTASYNTSEADGTTVQIVYTLGTLSGGSITASIGGSTLPVSSTNSTFTAYTTETATTDLTFTPTATGVRVVLSTLTVKVVTNGTQVTQGVQTNDGSIVSRFIGSSKYKHFYIDPFNLGASTATPGFWYSNGYFYFGDPTYGINVDLRGAAVFFTAIGYQLTWDANFFYPSSPAGLGRASLPWDFLVLKNKITVKGGVVPVVSGCGTSPTVATGSSNLAGIVTAGADATTGCVITFGAAFTNTPVCIVQTTTGTVFTGIATTNTAITLTAASLANAVIKYHCIGLNE